MKRSLHRFLSLHSKKGDKLLLALSGGSDSLALFHLLNELCPQFGLEFHAAHVNHNWRDVSTQEGAILQKMCANYRVPFHLKTLDKSNETNLEEKARLQRYSFFKALTKKYQFSAVLTAHHADDQAETVLKRVLEGASLPKLQGLREVSVVFGLTLWRPLLSCRKKQMIAMLKKKGVTPFFDETNQDPRFLRTRMRQEIFPLISRCFGKEVVPALCQIGSYANELHAFADDLVAPYLKSVKRCGLGVWVDFSLDCPKTPFEWKWVLRAVLAEEHLFPSTSLLEQVTSHLRRQSANISLRCQTKTLQIDRGSLFMFYKPTLSLKTEIPLVLGSQKVGPWRVEVERGRGGKTNWRTLWHGGGAVCLPSARRYGLSWGSKVDSKSLCNAKVPRFLQDKVPVVVDLDSKKISHEFLTGKKRHPPFSEVGTVIKIFTPEPLFSVEEQIQYRLS